MRRDDKTNSIHENRVPSKRRKCQSGFFVFLKIKNLYHLLIIAAMYSRILSFYDFAGKSRI